MLFLQAGVLNERFWLWGETSVEPSAPRRRRRSKAERPDSLPFATRPEELRSALGTALADGTKHRPGEGLLFAWLPTLDGQALASSPLIAEPPESKAEPVLAAWALEGVALGPEMLVALLAACLDRPTLAPGLVAGSTLVYWSTALRLAGALVAREQFLPGVRQGDEAWHARWKPLLTGAEATRFTQLARAMPPACRALGTDAAIAPARPATEALEEFLTLAVDALVRSASLPARSAVALDSVHDRWLHALRAGDDELGGPEADSLDEQVRAWTRPVTALASAPFRLCFRLEEPAANGQEPAAVTAQGSWYVRYLLQGQTDPSLLIPAADAWKTRGKAAGVLKRAGFEAREHLLLALGQAAGLSPGIEASLREAAPAGFPLDTAEAHRFLTETAAALEQAGFGVLLPAWWTRKGTKQKLTLTAHVKSPPGGGGSGLSLADLVVFDWRAALGEHSLSLAELEALAKLKSPLVQVRGQWVQMSAAEIQQAIDFWKKQGQTQATARHVVRLAMGATLDGLGVGRITAEGWVKDLLANLEDREGYAPLPPPAGFTGTLRPYQQRGYSWLAYLRRWGLGACLADDMGLGKTVQALAMLQHDREAGETRPALLVCPMSVVGNWTKEAARFTPGLAVMVHHGLKRARGDTFAKQANRHGLVLTSYSLLHRDLALFAKTSWAGVILDEAQNIKNPHTKQAKAARALEADYRIALTGTPVENHVGDLWSIWEFLEPGWLGGQTEFRRSFQVPIQVQRDAEAAQRLKRLTGPFLLRRLKTDKTIIADLPDKLEMKVYCNLTKEQASLYAAVVKQLEEALNDAEGIRRSGVVLGALSKLKQVCNHPAQFLGDNSAIADRSGKLARLTEMLEEVLDAGDRALVFTQFTEMGDILKKHLQETFGQEVLFLHGGVSRKGRDRLVERFRADDGPRIFLLSLKAGGTGLNLTEANHVFHFDRWWNPAVENQATDRAFRIGQKKNVQVHKFLCVGTLEEKIDEMIEKKSEVASWVVGSGEAWLTEMTNSQLRELIALRPEAVAE